MVKKSKLMDLKQTGRMVIAFLLLAIVILAGCQGQSILDVVFPQQEESFGVSESTPKPENAVIDEANPTPESSEFIDLTIWLPQQFDITGETEAAVMLKKRLLEFSENNPKINLSVRVKPAAGPGSIIETLISASAVAPDALPSLILISRSDLVQAASKNLLVPISGLSGIMDESDWFDVSRELGTYEGTVYCLPFAANALGLVYEHSGFNSDQPNWEETIRLSEKIFFASGDPEALTTIALYQSAGGVLSGRSEQLSLDPTALTMILSAYAVAVRNNRISDSVLDFQTDDQAWDAFLSSNRSSVLTWANHVLAEASTYRLAMLPSFGNEPFTLASGWMWCMTEPHEKNRIYDIALGEDLTDPDFLASWVPISGFLPVRPSSITSFEETELQNTISKILLSAHVRPAKTQISEIGAEIKRAISEVILQQYSPEESAQNAIIRLEAMNSQ